MLVESFFHSVFGNRLFCSCSMKFVRARILDVSYCRSDLDASPPTWSVGWLQTNIDLDLPKYSYPALIAEMDRSSLSVSLWCYRVVCV